MQQFLRRLLDRVAALQAAGARSDMDAARLDSLALAVALLRHRRDRATGARPLQIAVLGPTQVGKSTVTNLLLGRSVAGVSPLAGYTVHAQGFQIGDQTNWDWAQELFPGAARVPRAHLTPERLDAWSLEVVKGAESSSNAILPPGAVVWDSPDFDSLAARRYREAVLELVALADVYVLVLSKEKYSDLTAWEFLQLLAPLRRPLIIVLNKLTPDAETPLLQSLRDRISQQVGDGPGVETVGLPYIPGSGESARLLENSASGLAAAVRRAAGRAAAACTLDGVRAFVRLWWEEWTAPLRAEHAAAALWRRDVDVVIERQIEAYRREYLDHPQRYDSFRRATIEMLQLLELPGIGQGLTQVRNVLTWPVRRLWAVGRGAWEARRGTRPTPMGDEQALQELLSGLLLSLRTECARRAAAADAAYWTALGDRLAAEEAALRERFSTAIREHQARVGAEINRAANQLYEILRERPALLNTLRGARATAEVAAIALTIKTGGAHLHDLLIAPGMFMLMSLLTEGAVGVYFNRVAAELKQRQLEHVRTTLVECAIRPALLARGDDLKSPRLIGLPPEVLAGATQALDEWERTRHE